MVCEMSFLTNATPDSKPENRKNSQFGVIQTCFKFQIFLTDLIPRCNTSKFLKEPAGFEVR